MHFKPKILSHCVLKLRGWKIGHGVHWEGPSALAITKKLVILVYFEEKK